MSRNKKKRDIISEQQFNAVGQMPVAIPEDDSPGDSADLLNEEYLVGLNFMPDEKNEYEGDGDSTEIIYADDKSTAPSEVPSDSLSAARQNENRYLKNARVISSEEPGPLSDLDTPSDTH